MCGRVVDGWGSNVYARVDPHGRLMTDATQRHHIFHHTIHHADTFNVYFNHIQQTAATDELIGYITYTGDEYLIISNIMFSTNSAGQTEFSVLRNPTGLSGGIDTVPVNLNFASKRPLDVTSKKTLNGTYTINYSTVGSIMPHLYLGWHSQPTYTYEAQDSMALKKDDTIAVLVNSESQGDKISVLIAYYEEKDMGMI